MLSSPLDWERLLPLAEHHGLLPRMYHRISEWPEMVPGPWFSQLQWRYRNNARRCLTFTAELIRVVEHLNAQGIDVLPHKGPILAQGLYGDVAQRQFRDLDIFVRQGDAVRAKRALADLGYRPTIQLSGERERAYIGSNSEYSFHGEGGRHLLEIQWRVVPRIYCADFAVEQFFERAETLRVGEREFQTLCAEDLLLVLCVHAAKHVWAQLSWLCEVLDLAGNERIDWDRLLKEAGRLGLMRIVAVNFLLGERLLGAALPEAIERWVNKDSAADDLTEEMGKIVSSSAYYHTESVAHFRLMMRMRERWRERARMVWRLAFTPGPGDWAAAQLPRSMSPLYGVVRGFRLAKRLASYD